MKRGKGFLSAHLIIMIRIHVSSEHLAVPRARGGSWGPWQASDIALELEETLGVVSGSSLRAQVGIRTLWGLGPVHPEKN